jgi:hypothetical protein
MYLADAASVRDKLPADLTTANHDLNETSDELHHGTIEDILTAAALAESMKEEIFGYMDDVLSESDDLSEEEDYEPTRVAEAPSKDCEVTQLRAEEEAVYCAEQHNEAWYLQDKMEVTNSTSEESSVFPEIGTATDQFVELNPPSITSVTKLLHTTIQQACRLSKDNKLEHLPVAELVIFRDDMNEHNPMETDTPRLSFSNLCELSVNSEPVPESSPSKRAQPTSIEIESGQETVTLF